MACIFHNKPCIFSDEAEAPKKSPQKTTKNNNAPGKKPNRIRHVARDKNKVPKPVREKAKKIRSGISAAEQVGKRRFERPTPTSRT